MANAKALAIVLLVGCSGDDTAPGGDGGVVQRGTVTVYTHPGLRVDFMSGATNEVLASVMADADGNAKAEIDYGDRAVIVGAGQVRVLDQLEPTKEYRDRWYLDGFYMLQANTTVTTSWTAPANASDYRVSSLCGGTRDVFSGMTSTSMDLCNAGDGILITAYDANYEPIGSVYQSVTSPSGPVTITAPFVPHRDVALTLNRASNAMVGDVSMTLITPEGAQLRDSPSGSGSPTITAKLPALDGTVRTFAVVSLDGVGARWLIDRRPVADTLMIDMDAVDLPYVQSLATTADASTVAWTQAGTGTATATVIGWEGPDDTSYRLVTRYTGANAVLPVLPADVTPPPMPSLGAFAMLVASPAGYEAAIEALGRERDPLMGDHTLYFSTSF